MRTIKTLAVTTVALASIAIAVRVYRHVAHGPIEFDRTVWVQNGTDSASLRLRMADGLLRSKGLLGKSRAEIAALLGPPTSTDRFTDADLIYLLGPERGFIAIDSEWLTLRLDGAGNVRDARIVTD